MKKVKNILKTIIIIMIITFMTNYISIADVGSFEDYDSGSSWDSSSSWDSDWDYDDYGYGSYSVGGSGIGILVFLVIIAIIAYCQYKDKKDINKFFNNMNNYKANYAEKTEEEVEKEVKQIDELFNKDEFLSWTKDVFVKLQEAWTKRDWSTIRLFETNELFEQHNKQLQAFIDRKQINVMEQICVKSAKLADFKQNGDKDVLTVILNSKMIDYIIDEQTGKILKGDKTTYRYSTYKMVFIRKTGIKTKPGTDKINTTNCPNCGAPTQITSSGKCEYCGSVITTGQYSWALSNLEKIEN